MTGIAHGWLAGLVGGSILFALTAAIVAFPTIRRRPALVAAMWLVVLVRFVLPLDIGGGFSLEAHVARVLGDSVWLFPALDAGAATRAGNAASGTGLALEALLLAAWAVVSLLLVIRIAAAHLATRRALSALTPASPELAATLAELARALGLRRPPTLLVGSRAPVSTGLFRPIVAIPTWIEPAALDHVLAHELAHVRRKDFLLAIIAAVAKAALFFWPLVWIAARRFAAAREAACDSLAVSVTGANRRDYARTLIAVSSQMQGDRSSVLAMAAPPSQLGARISGLLASGGRGRLGLLGGAVLLAQIVFALPGSVEAKERSLPWGECIVSPGVGVQLLSEYPDADRNGDGFLSRSEICAHQERLRARVSEESPVDPFIEVSAPMCPEAQHFCEEGESSQDVGYD